MTSNPRNPNPNQHYQKLYEKTTPLTTAQAAGIDMFNRATRSIQSQREQRVDHRASRRQQLDAEWGKVFSTLSALHERVRANPKVAAFNLSERARTVSVIVRDGPSARPMIIYVQRSHTNPEHDQWDDALWIFRQGEQEQRFNDADSLIREFAVMLAALVT